jgi:predicted AlkP superfamily phosphohydrolase/phosphomutase
LLSVYQAVDAAIGRLLEGRPLDEMTLMVVAAHGMGQNASQEHFTRLIMDRVNQRFQARRTSPRLPARCVSAV